MKTTRRKARDFKIGEEVIHRSHGKGTVFSYDRVYEDDIYIDFDVQPVGWDKILCVTANLLKKVGE